MREDPTSTNLGLRKTCRRRAFWFKFQGAFPGYCHMGGTRDQLLTIGGKPYYFAWHRDEEKRPRSNGNVAVLKITKG